jgi:hypothetical protein
MEIDPDRKGFIAIAKIAKPTVETSERYAGIWKNSYGAVEKNSGRKPKIAMLCEGSYDPLKDGC